MEKQKTTIVTYGFAPKRRLLIPTNVEEHWKNTIPMEVARKRKQPDEYIVKVTTTIEVVE